MTTESDRDSLVPSDAEAIGRVSGRAAMTRLMRIVRIIEPSLPPELTGDFDGVDAGRRPPGLLVADAMDRAMMRAAERDQRIHRSPCGRAPAAAGSGDDADRIVCGRR